MNAKDRAVYTFWTKPEKRASYAWASPQMMLNSWIVSIECARKNFDTIVLRTDEAGAKMLVDGIGLGFDDVIISLEDLDSDKYPWTICKLLSYADEAKIGPAIHMDFDLFLDSIPDKSILDAPLFCQNIEPEVVGTPHYIDDELTGMKDVPDWYWRWHSNGRSALNCGILGWNDCEFVEFYAKAALKFIKSNAGKKWGVNAIVPEQAFLGAAVMEKRIPVKTFYDSWDDFYRGGKGMIHLIAMRKSALGNEMQLDKTAKSMRQDLWQRAQELGAKIAREKKAGR